MTKAMEEARVIARLQAGVAEFDAEVAEELAKGGERADLWSEIDVSVHDVRILLAALSAASALTAGEREPVAWRWKPKGHVMWTYNPDPEWMAAQSRDEIDAEQLYTSPPASELEALRKERDAIVIRFDEQTEDFVDACRKLRAAEARLAEALKALGHCEELLMRHQINHVSHEEISDMALDLIRAARRVREGGK